MTKAIERLKEAQAEIITGQVELQSLLTVGPFIDLGFECSVSAQDVAAIKVYTMFDRDNLGIEYFVGDLDLILSVVRLRECSLWLPSSLTYKELRNQLRKAAKAATGEVFI